MVPIIAGLVAGEHTNSRHGFYLSVCYVLGMSLTYTLAGMLCALMGAQVQAIFQAPLVIMAFAVLVSMLVSFTLTPMMSAYLLKPARHAPPVPFWMSGYMRMVRWCLNHRFWTALGAGLFFVASLSLIPCRAAKAST